MAKAESLMKTMEKQQDTAGKSIRISGISKQFATENKDVVHALSGIDLDVDPNDFICIVGPSGCGKSTLLRILAGLERPSSGTAMYGGSEMMRPRKDVGMVFQEYSLLPWRTVEENVVLGLVFSKAGKAKRREAAKTYLRLIGMERFAKAYPYELSGGMRQRVAIARALANAPDVLLMDEPFGALDAHTRILLQKELLRIREQQKTTILFVTHSVDEAVFLADRILVMSARPGRIVEEIPVAMKRPRDRAMPEFGQLTARILSMLEAEVGEMEIKEEPV